jgi:hypothetical protein
VFATLPAFDELNANAAAVPALGRAARGLAPHAALLLACVHRVAHHFDSRRLIWLYDIHLLASTLSDDEWERFVALAAASDVTVICRQSLLSAKQRLSTPIPDRVLCDPRWSTEPHAEPTAAYLTPRSRAEHVLGELRALPRWRDRVQLVRQHLFPPRRYMREVYAVSSRAPLPILYASRVVRGARRWLERAPARDEVRQR